MKLLYFLVVIIILNKIFYTKEGIEDLNNSEIDNNITDEVTDIVEILKENNIDSETINNIKDQLEIKEVCGAFIAKIDDQNMININLNKEQIKELSMKDYKLKIKSGESFHEKLDILEKKVFEKYYEDGWENKYNKMLKKRKKKIKEYQYEKCKGYNFNKETEEEETHEINRNYNSIENSLKTLSYLEDIEDYKNKRSPETNEREIYYREKEEYKLEKINEIMNYLYIFLFVTLLIILYMNKQINILGNWYIYIFLIMLPVYIYPFVFNIIKIGIENLKEFKNNRENKNAIL